MTKLDRETVIQAALELLNEVGIDNLTTRKLAERLEVQQPALYWHFRNKRALLDALSEAMLTKNHTRTVPQTGEDWRIFLKENALSFRKALLSYRDGARIHAGTRPTSAQYERVEKQIRFLCESGFEQSDAVRTLVIVSHYTTGSVSEQQAALADSSERKQASKEAPAQPSEFLSHAFDTFDAEGADFAFEYGLDALISGLEMKKATK